MPCSLVQSRGPPPGLVLPRGGCESAREAHGGDRGLGGRGEYRAGDRALQARLPVMGSFRHQSQTKESAASVPSSAQAACLALRAAQ